MISHNTLQMFIKCVLNFTELRTETISFKNTNVINTLLVVPFCRLEFNSKIVGIYTCHELFETKTYRYGQTTFFSNYVFQHFNKLFWFIKTFYTTKTEEIGLYYFSVKKYYFSFPWSIIIYCKIQTSWNFLKRGMRFTSPFQL